MQRDVITREIIFLAAEEVDKFFEECNQKQFFEEKVGVKRVNDTRWKEAQYYERKTWCGPQTQNMREDRNTVHRHYFDNYKILNDILPKKISVIELGCGPFTNLNFMLPFKNSIVTSIDLLDPLINDYVLGTTNCVYKNGSLNFIPVNLHPNPIENFNLDKSFDLVVIINVLEHCFNIDLIFEKIDKMLKPGGILVFADKYHTEERIKHLLDTLYDAGHPILISDTYIKEKLAKYKNLYAYKLPELTDGGTITGTATTYQILQK